MGLEGAGRVSSTSYTYNGTTQTWADWCGTAGDGWLAYAEATQTVFTDVAMVNDIPDFPGTGEWDMSRVSGITVGTLPARANIPSVDLIPSRITMDATWWQDYTGTAVTVS